MRSSVTEHPSHLTFTEPSLVEVVSFSIGIIIVQVVAAAVGRGPGCSRGSSLLSV
jgi:hypothetical protein